MTSTSRETPLNPLILLCLAATWLIWGSTYLAIKWALVSLPPFFQMGTRFLLAGAVLMAWMRIARGAAWPSRRQWKHALCVGALMLGGGMGGTAFAEQSVESGLAGVIMLTQGTGFGTSPIGLSAMAVACASWSIGSVMSQRRWVLAPGAMGFASEMICGGLVLLALSALSGEPPKVAGNWPFDARAVMAWSYLVVFGSLMAFNAYMVLLARAPAGLAASYTFVNPVIALLLGVWLADEVVSPFEWMAAAVILLGVVLLMARRWR